MNKKILVVFVCMLAVAMLATPIIGLAYAKPSEPVSGTILIIDTVPAMPPKVAGESDNRIIMLDIFEEWSGDIEGFATTEARWIVHNAPLFVNPDAWVNVNAILTFADATVLGKSGTLTIKVHVAGTDSHWTIMGGTGELANVHGQGTASTATTPFTYTGKVHFDP
jgi:hypothetical protein